MPRRLPPFPRVIDVLATFYGEPEPATPTEPFEMILWENIAYLASDKKRAEAFAELKSTVGLRPADIRRARERTLLLITSKGIVAGHSADKLRAAAEIAKEFDDDLQSILQEPTPLAKKALRRFPAIGDPAAEKILLFNHRLPVLALESNGLRVLVRLGYSSEKEKLFRDLQGNPAGLGHATFDGLCSSYSSAPTLAAAWTNALQKESS